MCCTKSGYKCLCLDQTDRGPSKALSSGGEEAKGREAAIIIFLKKTLGAERDTTEKLGY